MDTHRDTHTAAVIDLAGRVLGDRTVPPRPRPVIAALLAWLRGFGQLRAWSGSKAPASYGAGLARHLHAAGRGDGRGRPARPQDAPRRSASPTRSTPWPRPGRAGPGRAPGCPRHRDGQVEALRNLRVARSGAVDARADCQRPDQGADRHRPRTAARRSCAASAPPTLIATCAGAAPGPDPDRRPGAGRPRPRCAPWPAATTPSPPEIADLDDLIEPAGRRDQPRPARSCHGVGPDVAGQLLVTAGQNPDRLRSEAAFAMLCGAAPLPASSGRTHRHRLNRGGACSHHPHAPCGVLALPTQISPNCVGWMSPPQERCGWEEQRRWWWLGAA